MTSLTQQRCLNHATREAVARCPLCSRFFCRECVTEHEDRMLCNACLDRATTAGTLSRRSWWSGLGLLIQGVVGFLLLWSVFFLIGQGLLAIPHAFHEGTIWQSPWWLTP